MGRISGPLMDRIDLHVEVTPVAPAELAAAAPGEPSAAIRERVVRARGMQAERFRNLPGVHTNAMMNSAMLAEYCLPLVKVGGSFLAMKGASGEDELAAARGAIRKLGGAYQETRTLHLPGGDTRTLILCKKISQTPTAYPRNGGKIAKSPLK